MEFKIAHIGFGWFGNLLHQKNQKLANPFSITFFNRSEKEGTEKFELGEDLDTPLNLRSANLLSISIPPGQDLEKYSELCEEIRLHWRKEKPILFMSTTSVFPKTSETFNEQSSFEPDTPRSKTLKSIEDDILNFFPRALILRSGGQVGIDRHPLTFLYKNIRPFQAKEPINFIHSEDLTTLVLFLFQKIQDQENLPKVLHAVSPEHPTKDEYYKAQAKLWDVPLPPRKEDSDLKRIIDSCYLDSLGFQFKKADCLVDKN